MSWVVFPWYDQSAGGDVSINPPPIDRLRIPKKVFIMTSPVDPPLDDNDYLASIKIGGKNYKVYRSTKEVEKALNSDKTNVAAIATRGMHHSLKLSWTNPAHPPLVPPPKNAPKKAPNAPKNAPKKAPNAPKKAPNAPKNAPKKAPNAPKVGRSSVTTTTSRSSTSRSSTKSTKTSGGSCKCPEEFSVKNIEDTKSKEIESMTFELLGFIQKESESLGGFSPIYGPRDPGMRLASVNAGTKDLSVSGGGVNGAFKRMLQAGGQVVNLYGVNHNQLFNEENLLPTGIYHKVYIPQSDIGKFVKESYGINPKNPGNAGVVILDVFRSNFPCDCHNNMAMLYVVGPDGRDEYQDKSTDFYNVLLNIGNNMMEVIKAYNNNNSDAPISIVRTPLISGTIYRGDMDGDEIARCLVKGMRKNPVNGLTIQLSRTKTFGELYDNLSN